MKKIYSVILLFSFLIGTLQPILPMIKYQLYRGSIIGFLSSDDEPPGPQEEILYSVDKSAETQGEDSGQSLLDDDFYPFAVQITTVPEPIAFPYKSRLYLPIIERINGPAYLPNPPPPRLS